MLSNIPLPVALPTRWKAATGKYSARKIRMPRRRAISCNLKTGCELAWGPDADRHAKILIIISLEGSYFGA